MVQQIEAVYENGILRPSQSLGLEEHERVRITITSEEWTSPELQLLVLTERKDPRNGDSTYRLTDIVRTEPSASLFQVPSDYTIRETGIKKFEYMRPEQ